MVDRAKKTGEIDAARLARLTELERAYLRLVLKAMTSKEIAREYGKQPGTVDKAMKSAMAKLGTSSRVAAARMVAEAERPQQLAPQSQTLELPDDPDMIGASGADRDRLAPPMQRRSVREEQATYSTAAARSKAFRLPVPRHEGDRNELSVGMRLVWIGLAALGVIVAVGTLITISTGIANTVDSIVRALS